MTASFVENTKIESVIERSVPDVRVRISLPMSCGLEAFVTSWVAR
jgi:hypothetical protein